MTKEEIKTYDNYAGQALNALISKLPLIDRDGELSKGMSQEDLNQIQVEMCESAHAYAYFMMNTRSQSLLNTTNELKIKK